MLSPTQCESMERARPTSTRARMQEDIREWTRTLEGLPSATLVDIILLLVSVLSAAEGSTGRVRYALNQVRRVAIQHHARPPSNLRDVTPVQALRAVRPTPPRSEVASPVAPVAKSRAKGKAKAKARAAASESAGSALEVGPFAMQPRGTVANYLPPTLPRRSVRAEGTAVAAAAAPVPEEAEVAQRWASRLALASRSRSPPWRRRRSSSSSSSH